jgi:hypothetical protein
VYKNKPRNQMHETTIIPEVNKEAGWDDKITLSIVATTSTMQCFLHHWRN